MNLVVKDRWSLLNEMFQVASALGKEERQIYLDQISENDLSLRTEIDKLLRYHESSTDVRLDQPVEIRVNVQPRDQESPDPLIGSKFGPYEIIRCIGHGGFGDVYLGARTTGFAQKVAIKVLRQDHESSETILRRFAIERQVLADLEHEGIARLIDGGSDERGRPYFVMEYVSGETILQYCDKNRLNTEERLELFCKACDAVAHAHLYGVVHRDIKPVNMLVTPHGIPKLVDFGIAKLTDLRSRREMLTLTREGLLPMTPEYASPEQIRGENVGLASDVYSLGVVLYELLAGRRPYEFSSRSPQDIERTVCRLTPVRPSSTVLPSRHPAGTETEDARELETISRNRSTDPRRLHRSLRDLDNVVLMALRKEPERRYRSAADLGEDIRRHLQGLPVVASADSVTYRMRKFVQRHTAASAASLVVLLSLIGMVVTLSVAWQRQRHLALQLQELLYVSDMQLGFEDLQRQDFRGVRNILQRHLERPKVTDQLGIEWHLLDALSNPPTPLVLEGHEGRVSEVAVVPGQPWVVSVAEDRKILVWNSDTGKLVTELTGSNVPLHSVAVSLDGRYLAVGGKELPDGKPDILLFDLWTSELLRTVHECKNTPESLAFSPDGEELAIGTRYDDVFLVSIKDGNVIAKRCTEARYWSLAFLADGTLLSPANVNKGTPEEEATIQLWNPDLKHLVHDFKATRIDRFALSRDQRWMVASSERYPQIALFDLHSRELVFTKAIGPGRVRCVAIAQDNQSIAVGYDDGTVRHWSLVSMGPTEVGEPGGNQTLRLTQEFNFHAHSGRVRSIAFTGRSQLVTCGNDGTVKIWHPRDSMNRRLGPPVAVDAYGASVSENGCAVLNQQGDIWINTRVDGQPWRRISGPYDVGFIVSPVGNRLALARLGEVEILDLQSCQTMHRLDHGNKFIRGVAFSPYGRWLAVTGNDKWTTVWDLELGEQARKITHADDGLCVQFSPDGKNLACGGSFRELQLYDTASGELTNSFSVNDETTALAWGPDSQTIATGHFDGDVVLHKLTNSEHQSTTLGSHEHLVGALMFSRDGRTLLTGSHDTTIRLWHVATGKSLGILHRGLDQSAIVVGLAQSSDGRKIFAALGGQDAGESILVFYTSEFP